jgi:hypothetical protein
MIRLYLLYQWHHASGIYEKIATADELLAYVPHRDSVVVDGCNTDQNLNL